MRRRKPRGSYKVKPMETRGAYEAEYRVARLFWREHKMEDLITKTPEEIDVLIEEFYTRWQEIQIKRDSRWWYPDSPKDRVIDIRKAK